MPSKSAVFRHILPAVFVGVVIGYLVGHSKSAVSLDEIAEYQKIARDASRNAAEALRVAERQRSHG